MLVEGWSKVWWRKVSTWLAALNGLLVTYVFSQPIMVIGLLGFAPGKWLIPLAVALGFLAFALPVLSALIKQPKVEAKIEEAKIDAAEQ